VHLLQSIDSFLEIDVLVGQLGLGMVNNDCREGGVRRTFSSVEPNVSLRY
jgi:hypothetical protein